MVFKANQRFFLVFVNIENRQQFRHGQQFAKCFRQLDEFDFAAFIEYGDVAGNEFAKPARIDMRYAGEIQKNQKLFFLNQRAKRPMQRYGCAANTYSAFQIENSYVSDLALFDIEIDHRSSNCWAVYFRWSGEFQRS